MPIGLARWGADPGETWQSSARCVAPCASEFTCSLLIWRRVADGAGFFLGLLGRGLIVLDVGDMDMLLVLAPF